MDRFAALILRIFQEDLMVPTKPDFQPCPEDDDFMAALDKMVNENIAESKNIGEPPKIFDTSNKRCAAQCGTRVS